MHPAPRRHRAKRRRIGIDHRVIGLSAPGPSACRGPWRNSGPTGSPSARPRMPSMSLRNFSRKPRALLGGVSRPSRKACTKTGRPRSRQHLDQRRHVILMRMHAAGRQQSHQMHGALAGFGLGDQVAQRRPRRPASRPRSPHRCAADPAPPPGRSRYSCARLRNCPSGPAAGPPRGPRSAAAHAGNRASMRV